MPVALSGIASTLLPGGRTAHSRFKIPIVLDDCSLCNIGHDSDIAYLLKETSLIIWDEAPMQHRYSFECLDRSLRDLMKYVHPDRFHIPFGGICVVFGGDFRQILPVIPDASRADVVSSCLKNSKLWSVCKLYTLKQNMRLKKATNSKEIMRLQNFADWVLAVGDGNIAPIEKDTCKISIPSEYCNVEDKNSVDKMICSVYPDFLKNFNVVHM